MVLLPGRMLANGLAGLLHSGQRSMLGVWLEPDASIPDDVVEGVAKYIAATMVITTMIHVANSLITPNIKTSDAPGGGRQAQMPSDDQKLAGVILILVASVGGLLFALW
eukprot:CAMPEP_0202370628 /NCGR_PEP_ID=MMETSP1127-20130417/2195_1 /ASSEMBLY_ACC=CAM_ASM_000462 /TAXON_ID=3047 /ORGANISM="Dunaliella tertiolecta, Strain CCMP1320" /LENGTH=108 /DNA_ID=CAMNT_0048966621 /DNA_START=263 /DNA_END=587 /DNA_ORIENTATION=-